MALEQRVGNWLRSVNLDTINLLEEVIELSASMHGNTPAEFQRAILELTAREAATRREFLLEGSQLKGELEALRFASDARQFHPLSGTHFKLARQVAAALLAIGMPATAGGQAAMGQEVKTTPQASSAAQQNLGSVSGTITDQTGAVIANATITITNTDTKLTRTLKTNPMGQYAANDLQAGSYTVKAEAQNFRTTEKAGIVLKAGARERADIVLTVGNFGCCEYAAPPMKTVADLTARKKPFTYLVGESADLNSFQGIASLVYGDSRKWVQIFEANRDVVEKPGFIPYGTRILIPPSKRVVPKLVSRVMPVYPAEAAKQHVSGDVVMEVNLKDDGTVERVNVIDGPSSLLEATTNAVKQWRYQPLLVNGKPVGKFVVVVSFGKSGKVRFH